MDALLKTRESDGRDEIGLNGDLIYCEIIVETTCTVPRTAWTLAVLACSVSACSVSACSLGTETRGGPPLGPDFRALVDMKQELC